MLIEIGLGLGGVLLARNLLRKRGGAIASPEARRLVEGGALLLDVRTAAEYAGGHVPNAVNIAVQELPSRVGEVGDKQRPVVVYCRSGGRSARAAKILEAAGYASVHDLGGMGNWGPS